MKTFADFILRFGCDGLLRVSGCATTQSYEQQMRARDEKAARTN